MSGKGRGSYSNSQSYGNSSTKNYGGGSSSSSSSSTPAREPEIVSGWEYHTYSRGDPDRYAYIGKDEDGQPEFLDYGRKGDR